MPRRSRLLVAVPLLCAFAPAPKPKEGDDAKALQGSWAAVRQEWDGTVLRPMSYATRVVIKGNRLEIREGEFKEALTFTLDPKGEPREITLVPDPIGGETKSRRSRPGIYKLEKDTLTICYSWNGGSPRPKEFATKPRSFHALLVFRRVKP